jgi:hypothetical protein
MRGVIGLRVALAGVLVLLVLILVPGSALAALPAAGYTVESFAEPTNFSPSSNDDYVVRATNVGALAAQGSKIKLTDFLPEGVTVQQIVLHIKSLPGEPTGLEEGDLDVLGFCSVTPVSSGSVSCEYPPGGLGGFLPPLDPDAILEMQVHVSVEANAPRVLVNKAVVSGGGAPEVATEADNGNSSAPPSFGPSNFNFYIAGQDGRGDTQAGDHPYELATTIALNNTYRIPGPEDVGEALLHPTSVEDVKDIVVNLPLGFVGSTLAAPECTLSDMSGGICPRDTIVGHIRTTPEGLLTSINSPLYNLVPERGVPAEFGYFDHVHGAHVLYTRVVPTSSGYVLQTLSPDIPQILLSHITVTFYGDPAARDEAAEAQVPFFTNPTGCTGEAPTATVYMDSWEHPARINADGTPVNLEEPQWVSMQSKSPPMTGCDALRFPAEVTAQPTTHEADKPSGLNFEIRLAQSETVGVVGTPTLKRVVVTLPEGFTVDPSAGDGLGACSEAQIGWLGGTHLNFSAAAPECPESSKIGSLELESPLVGHKLEGELFLARQNENPFASTLAAYVVVHDPITGVLIKIAGKFLPDPHTGRLTAVFDENPNLPFSDLQLHFFAGPRAELATPEACGIFTTDTQLEPYSAPDSGPPAIPSDSFLVNEACPGGFSPSFTAGSLNLQAGAYTSFVASFERSDTDQELAGLSVSLPPGLLANVASVPECSDAEIAQAEEGSGGCPESTRVGTVKAGAGPGPNPLFVAGKAYWTGPYRGAPFGIAVVVPAIAGPFNFGTVVVRQAVRIDPYTAHVTDVSDPFPTIIDGIPLRLRRVDLYLDRPGFTFNPTNCSKEQFAGTITGFPLGAPTTLQGTVGHATQPGESSNFTTPFQVTNCATLGFAPKFAVSTSGHTSRTGGASLTATLSEPNLPLGGEANVARVKVELPKQLPSRLTTLQKACPDAQFEADPAGCPAASRIGYAVVHTPIVPVALEGPVIFVSHGGEAFPSLTIVLQGDGVTIDLVGTTFISKAGITSTTFKTVPDTPFSTFTLTLPEGQYSALAALGSLCKAKSLVMPTEFIAQNGAQLNQNTKIAVTGCPKAAHKRKKARKANHGHGKARKAKGGHGRR